MNISPNLTIEEVVPPETYQKYGQNSIWFIDRRIINVFEIIRKDLGPLIVNTWSLPEPKILGEILTYCGYRPPGCTTGAPESDHKARMALDLHSLKWKAEEMREYVRKNFVKLNEAGLTTIELGTATWLHISSRWTGLDKLLEVPFYK